MYSLYLGYIFVAIFCFFTAEKIAPTIVSAFEKWEKSATHRHEIRQRIVFSVEN